MPEEKKKRFTLLRFHQFEIAALLLILTAAFIIRWLNVDQAPRGLEQDEIHVSTAAFFEQHGVAPIRQGVWSGIEGSNRNFPVSGRFLRAGYRLFGDDLYSPRKILVLCSVLSLFFFYLHDCQLSIWF